MLRRARLAQLPSDTKKKKKKKKKLESSFPSMSTTFAVVRIKKNFCLNHFAAVCRLARTDLNEHFRNFAVISRRPPTVVVE